MMSLNSGYLLCEDNLSSMCLLTPLLVLSGAESFLCFVENPSCLAKLQFYLSKPAREITCYNL